MFFLVFVFFFLMGYVMTSFLPFTGRSLDCLLSKPGLMPQSLFFNNRNFSEPKRLGSLKP